MSDLEQTLSEPKFGGGASDGVGFGNKSNAASAEPEVDNSATRFGKHEDTAPYSGHGTTKHASGTVGGAGFGNKATESFNKNDSTMGKFMEKAGTMMHSKHVFSAGAERRRSAGYVEDSEEPKE